MGWGGGVGTAGSFWSVVHGPRRHCWSVWGRRLEELDTRDLYQVG